MTNPKHTEAKIAAVSTQPYMLEHVAIATMTTKPTEPAVHFIHALSHPSASAARV
jgi:hypothetical protein